MTELTAVPWMSVSLHDSLLSILWRECWNMSLHALPLCVHKDAGKCCSPCIEWHSVKADQIYEALMYMVSVLQIL